MKRVEQFLKKAGTYYLATVEGDQPRVILFTFVLSILIICLFN